MRKHLFICLTVVIAALLLITPVLAATDLERQLQQAEKEYEKAELNLLQAVDKAQKSYDKLKATKGTEMYHSLENAAAEMGSIAGDELMGEIKEIVVKREVGKRFGHLAGKTAGTYLSFLGACKTYYDVGQLIAMDATLTARNIKTNWQVMTKVWPARIKYDKAKKKYDDLRAQVGNFAIVPDVVGKTISTATRLLAQAGLKALVIKYVDSNNPLNKDRVKEQSIAPNKLPRPTRGTTVMLTVYRLSLASVTLPDFVEKPYNSSCAWLIANGIQCDRSYIETDNQKLDGIVVSTSPKAGSTVKRLGRVHFGVYKYYPTKTQTVPSVVGKSESDATRLISQANLKTLVNRYVDSANPLDKDKVKSQDPKAGQSVKGGSTVKLTVYRLSLASVTLPDFVEKPYNSSCAWLIANGIQCDRSYIETDNQRLDGIVVSTSPKAGSTVKRLGRVHFGVYKYYPTKTQTVPSVVGKSESDATRLISQANLKTLVNRYVDSANPLDKDKVKSQDPKAGQSVKGGSTVKLTVYRLSLASVTLPDFVEKPYNSSCAWLIANGIQCDRSYVETDNQKLDGIVVSTSPKAGSTVKRLGRVHFGVYKYYPTKTQTVPSVVGKSESDATRLISQANLKTLVNRYVDSANPLDKDKVKSQDPKAGQSVKGGSTVKLTVYRLSLISITLPDFVEKPYSSSCAWLIANGIKCDRNLVTTYDRKLDGIVVSTSPKAGSKVKRLGRVLFNVYKFYGEGPRKVPSVKGKSESAARSELQKLKFKVQDIDQYTDDSRLHGKVIKQSPEEGKQAAYGSKVNIYVGRPRSGIVVPNVANQTLSEAKKTLEKAGLKQKTGGALPTSDKSKHARVAQQNPKAGAKVSRGSYVTTQPWTYVANRTVRVPDVRGQSLDRAKSLLSGVSLGWRLGTPVTTNDKSKEYKVAKQSPAPKQNVKLGSSVTIALWGYKPGSSETITLPNLKGVSWTNAKQTAQKLGFKVADSFKATNKSYNHHKVYSTNPPSGAKMKKGDTVQLVVYQYQKPQQEDEYVKVPIGLPGQNLPSAEKKLKSVGLKASTTFRKTSSKSKHHIVISTNPTGYAKVKKGTSVKLTVYKYEEDKQLTIPTNLIGNSLSTVEKTLKGMGLVTRVQYKKTTNKKLDNQVVSTSPAAKAVVRPGNRVTIEAYKYESAPPDPKLVEVPSGLIGLRGAQAKSKLAKLGLKTKFEYTRTTHKNLHDQVRDTYPAANTKVKPGSVVAVKLHWDRDILRPEVRMPVYKNMVLSTAQTVLKKLGLKWKVRYQPTSDKNLHNKIASTKPSKNTVVKVGQTIELTAYKYEDKPVQLVMPNVINKFRGDAEKALKGMGLKVNISTKETNNSKLNNKVASTNPIKNTVLKAGQTIQVLVYLYKEEPKEVTLPDLKGHTQANAEKRLRDLGLKSTIKPQNTMNPNLNGKVVSTNPTQKSKVKPGSVVQLIVYKYSKDVVKVPNLVGMMTDNAKSAITKAGLKWRLGTAVGTSDKSKQYKVAKQSPSPGVKVTRGSYVTTQLWGYVESKVSVPSVLNKTLLESKTIIERVGLKPKAGSAIPTTDKGKHARVAKQSPAPGAKVTRGSYVTTQLWGYVESKVSVPSVLNKTLLESKTIIERAGLKPKAGSAIPTTNKSKHARVAKQSPSPGAKVTRGSYVTTQLWGYVESRVSVPSVLNKTLLESKTIIERAGLKPKAGKAIPTTNKSKHARVAKQSPAPGAKVTRGSYVTTQLWGYVESKVSVPSVLNKTLLESKTIIERAGLKPKAGSAIPTTDKSKHARVAKQSPSPGAKVTRGSYVTTQLWGYVASNKVALPNVVNQSYSNASKNLSKVGMKCSRSDIKTSNRSLHDKVRKMTPSAGYKVNRGSTVMLEVYKYEDNRSTVPNVVNQSSGTACSNISRAGLKCAKKYVNTSSSSQNDKVRRMSPSAGYKVNRGSTVMLEVYKYEDNRSTVPNVVNQSSGTACSNISRAGLKCAKKYVNTSSSSQNDKVRRMSPSAGSKLNRGSTVTIEIYKYEDNRSTVPNVVNQSYSNASKNLSKVGMKCSRSDIKTSNRSLHDKVRKMTPSAGYKVNRGSTVMLEVYKYVDNRATVPNVVNQSSGTACSNISRAGLRCAKKYVNTSTSSKKDKVRSVNPRAGSKLNRGSTVTIEVYKYVDNRSTVPNVVNQSSGTACSNISRAGLKCAKKYVNTSSSSKKDKVRNVNPRAGSKLNRGSTVTIEVYKYEDNRSTVPNVVNQSSGTACSNISRAGLRCAKKYVNTSTSSKKDKVRSVNPRAGSKLNRGSTVTIEVYKYVDNRSTVPNVVNQSSGTACSNISRAGLRCAKKYVNTSTSSKKDKVRSVNPRAGSKLNRGSTVTIEVYEYVDNRSTVPNVVNQSSGTACSKISRADLRCSKKYVNTSSSSKKDKVRSVSPSAGSKLNRGSTVTIEVYKYVDNRSTVPNVVNQSSGTACSNISRAGLKCAKKYVNTSSSSKKDKVRSVSPSAGSKLNRGSTVTIEVYKYVDNRSTVPNVVNQSSGTACSNISRAGLKCAKKYVNTSSSSKKDKVRRMSPSAGSKLNRGSTVTLEVYKYQVSPITVPNLIGISLDRAKSLISKAGLKWRLGTPVGTKDKSKQYKIAKQSPSAGAKVKKGSSVTLILWGLIR